MEDRERTGSPLRTQTQYRRTLGEEPTGPRLTAGPVFDRCIEAAICNKSAAHTMKLWKIAQGLAVNRIFRCLRGVTRYQPRQFGVSAAGTEDADRPQRRRRRKLRQVAAARKAGQGREVFVKNAKREAWREGTTRGSSVSPRRISSTMFILDGREAH